MSGRHRRSRRAEPGRGRDHAVGTTDSLWVMADGTASGTALPADRPEHQAAAARSVQVAPPVVPDAAVEAALAELEALRSARAQLDARQALLVRSLASRGVGWMRIGEALGVTRQAAHQRYSSK